MHFTVSSGRIVHKKIGFFQIIFFEWCSVEILSDIMLQGADLAILLILYFQKNQGN